MTLCTPCFNVENDLPPHRVKYQPQLNVGEQCPRCAHTHKQERQEMNVSSLDKEHIVEAMSMLNRLRVDWENVSGEEQHGSVVEAYHQLEQSFGGSD